MSEYELRALTVPKSSGPNLDVLLESHMVGKHWSGNELAHAGSLVAISALQMINKGWLVGVMYAI